MPEKTVAQEKLVQYLNEAYGLEQRLETALQAHLAMTTHAAPTLPCFSHSRRSPREWGSRAGRSLSLGALTAEVVDRNGGLGDRFRVEDGDSARLNRLP